MEYVPEICTECSKEEIVLFKEGKNYYCAFCLEKLEQNLKQLKLQDKNP